MKSYCIFSDVHGNIDVLNKLIETDDFKKANKRIFLGDAVGCCPFFNETLKALYDNKCIVLLGNHDVRAVFNRFDKTKVGNRDEEPHFSYIRSHMLPEYKEKLKEAPHEYVMKINKKTFYFTHYIWRTKYYIADRVKPIIRKNVNEKFAGIDADYIFYGHEHKQSFFQCGDKTLVGVGSLGMKCPGHYVMLRIDDDGKVKIVCKQIKYDLRKLRREIRQSELPQAKEITDEFNF